jgi:DNA-binding GntR family transcriptional regulator
MAVRRKKTDAKPKTSWDSGGSLSESAYKQIHKAIQSGSLKPGTRLRELELTDWLGISRTPIREALKRLENDGLIFNEPNQGLVVTRLDSRMISEIYEIREVLEGTAAAFAAKQALAGEITVLRDIVSRESKIKDDPVALVEHNRIFHEALYRSTHNRYLQKFLNTLRESMALWVHTTLSVPGRSQEALDQHDRIVSAIEKRDSIAAEQAARQHIRDAYMLQLKLIDDFDAK